MSLKVDLDVPEKLLPIFTEKKRYKIAHGGRGGGKSETFARFLILKSYAIKGKILCAREVQKSIDESVYALIKDTIELLGLTHQFDITKNRISNKLTGSMFIFHGLRDLSVDSIKSIKGIKIVWVEEAHGVSINSWRVLKPTVREENSQIWASFNRKFRKDPVWREFCETPDEDTVVIKINWYDNPFFPEVLRKEKDRDYKNLPKDEADHIWEGNPQVSSGLRVYRFDITKNTRNKRIPYTPGHETWSMWDFGVADPTAIAIVQILPHPDAPNGIIINFIDEKVERNQRSEYYKKWILNHEHYGGDWKHAGDPAGTARSHDLSSWVDQLAPEIGIEYTHGKSVNEFVDLANKYVPSVRINESQTPQFYDMFTNWEYPKSTQDENLPKEGAKPQHDIYSHPGTAFYYFIMERFNPDYQNRRIQII